MACLSLSYVIETPHSLVNFGLNSSSFMVPILISVQHTIHRRTDRRKSGREPPSLLTYIPRTAKVDAVGKELLRRDKVLRELKENIKLAQGRMKKIHDNRHREVEFEEGEWVFLKPRPYRQLSVYMRKNAKLAGRFFGPFQIVKKISPVAYKLELPKESQIHLVFHVSLLRRKLGGDNMVLNQLPEIDENA